jgi:hypothetical protein
VLNGLPDYRYSGIDNGNKVRKLMMGINTDALDNVKATVLASPALRTNYPDVATLYGDFVKQQKIESASMNMSDAHITRRYNGPASVAGSDYEASYDGVVKTCFTTMPNIVLCHPTKNELRLKLNHRIKGNDRRSNDKPIREDERKKDKKTTKYVTRNIAELSCNTDDPESSSDEAYLASKASDPPAKSNRKNTSLTRQTLLADLTLTRMPTRVW